MIRVDHHWPGASRDVVGASVTALGAALVEAGLTVDLEGARRAVAGAWA
ncbi:hypothetical protein [Streptomyces beihaiensis]|nr:hypothetical protein [Streptomyces beihaiensis]